MPLYCGTSGYSYKEWKGPFYPKDLPNREMLRYYGANLPAVEINNTFYRMPSAGVLESWLDQVPAHFRFILKAPRAITHARPLKEKDAEVAYLFRTAATLGDRLGAILFQLPPYLHRDTALLTDFMELLPAGTRTAFEFRHPSWFDEAVYALLRGKGSALCCSDSENQSLLRLVATADWGYLRLRKANYAQNALREWIQRIITRNWQTVYVFFKHEDAGTGPELARQFLELAAREGLR